MKRIVVCLLAGIFILAGIAAAQDTRSTITGHVKDAQDALIPDATVVVTNTETNATVKLKTNDVGYFEAALLMPGPYTVSAEAPGFKRLMRSGVSLSVSDRREVEMVLEVGAVTESVNVNAEAPMVDVSRADSGRILDDRSVRDLPANANTVYTLVRFAAGVEAGAPPTLLGPHSTQGAATSYESASGLGGNTWTIDGAINDGSGRYTANLPSVDVVAESKVLTTTFEGSFGHSLGLGVAVQTKTGTNQYHGTASDTYWSQRWWGSTFFAKQTYYKNIASLNAQGKTAEAEAAAAKPIQPSGHSNMFNLVFSGPVRIPKIFNGRDKVFFTFAYNGERDVKSEESSTYNKVVPTLDNRKGDFSDLLRVASNPQNYQLYDPYSTKPDPARPGHYVRTPISGNILPGQYIAMGKKFYDNWVKYYPEPNNWFDKTTTPSTNPFLSITAPYNWPFNQFSGRLDVNVGSNHRFFGRFTQNHFYENRGDWTVDIMPGISRGGVWRDDQNGVLDWVYTITPTTMFHAAFSISNWDSSTSVGDVPFTFKPSDFGLPKYMDDKCGTKCYMPQPNISGYTNIGIGGVPGLTYNTFTGYNADLYVNRGNHSLRAGLDFRGQAKSNHAGNNDGQYTFGNNYFRRFDDSGGVGYSAGGIGLSWASFMMGMPTSETISNNADYYVSNPYYAAFGQDTWRVNRKLTLTLSLRMEYELGARERHNRYIVDYDQNAALPISAAVEAAYAAKPQQEVPVSQFKITGGAIYAGAPGAPTRAWSNALMWLPRIGFGYQIDKKTVVRGGYGLYFDTNNVNVSFGPTQEYFSKATQPTLYNNDANQIPVFTPLFSANGAFPTVSPLNDPFPIRSDGTRFDAPLGNSLGLMARVGSGWSYNSSKIHTRQQRWRIGIERQVGPNDVIDAAYEGTYASNLVNSFPPSLGVPSTFYNFTQTRNDTNANFLGATVPNPFYGLTTSGTVPANANAIYPDAVKNNTTLWTWMATNTLFTNPNRGRTTLLYADPNGNVNTPVAFPDYHNRTQMITLSYNHRFSKLFSANVGYTWLRRKSATGFFQDWDERDPIRPQVPYWNPLGSGNPNRLTATWVFDLPFGAGRPWLQGTIPGLIFGGWTISGTAQFVPGGLLGFGNIYYYGDPNDIKIDNPTPGHYFNTAGCVQTTKLDPGDTIVGTGPCTSGFEKRSAFAASSYQYRFMPTNIEGLRGAGTHQIDGSLTREFKIWERISFQVRVDALNVENNGILSSPNLTPTSSTFGQQTGEGNSPRRYFQVQGHLRW